MLIYYVYLKLYTIWVRFDSADPKLNEEIKFNKSKK